jgi:hypothetical protein
MFQSHPPNTSINPTAGYGLSRFRISASAAAGYLQRYAARSGALPLIFRDLLFAMWNLDNHYLNEEKMPCLMSFFGVNS